MLPSISALSELRWQLREVLVIAKKNAMVYYMKPPVLTFGVVFPFFSICRSLRDITLP